MQQLFELRRFDPHDRIFGRDQPLAHHVCGDRHGCLAGALAVSSLQHIQASFLNSELEILHIAIVTLEAIGDFAELPVALGHDAFKLANGRRRADAGNDVFALRVDQKLTVEFLFSSRGIAREPHAGARSVTHVSEHHSLHVHCRSQ